MTAAATGPPAPRRSSVRMGLAALALSLCVTLVILELALIVSGFSATPVDIQVGQTPDARAYHVFEDANFEYHPDLIWAPRAGTSIFNAQGFRGDEVTPVKPPGAIRVFTVGDSNTLGWAGADGVHWPGELQTFARQMHPAVTVVNAGVWGYASYQGLRRFRQTLAFDPDVVLISFGSNDAHWVTQPDRDYSAMSFRRTVLGQLMQKTRLGELAISVIEGGSRPDATLVPRVSLDDFRANLTAMIGEARARRVEIVLLTRPYVGSIPNAFWWKNRGADYSAATAEIAAAEAVPMIDVYSFFKGRDELFADESHFTDEGHRIAALIILDHLRPILARRGAPAPAGGITP